jgi:hypothetical protein
MIHENSDPVAMEAQADLDRFFDRIIKPTLIEFQSGTDIAGGEAPDMDTFLDNCRQVTHNALCYEIRRNFALIIGATFERHLRLWLAHGAPSRQAAIERMRWPELVETIDELRGLKLRDMNFGEDIDELWLVTNAVRHGEGQSATNLADARPGLWNHLPADRAMLVRDMRVRDADLYRYVLAAFKFWHKARASSVPGIPYD